MKKDDHVFWVSYSDLMTSLFFIMLVLFVVTVGHLKVKQGELMTLTGILQQEKDSLLVDSKAKDQLLQLDKQFEPLLMDGCFEKIGDKYVYKDLLGVEIFKPNEVTIKEEYVQKTIDAGKKLESFLADLYCKDKGVKYLLVIEGNMARSYAHPGNTPEDSQWGYETSYQRALAVYQLWRRYNINLRRYNTEIMICGSGFNGQDRDSNENNNKRFVIQIIPKVNYNKQ